MLRRALLLATMVIAVVAGSSGTVSAHATLISTTPTNGSVVDVSPTEVLLTFSEAIDPVDPAVRVVDGDGNDVATSGAHQKQGADTLAINLDEPLDEGTYVVAWQAVSADSHKIRGAFTFSVGAASATRSGLIDDLFDSADSQPSGSGVLAIGRFASYAGIAVVLGGLVAATAIAPSMVRPRRTAQVLWAALGVAIVGTATMIAAQANLVGSSPLDWAAVADTRAGRWWVIRLVVIGALAIVIQRRHHLGSLPGRLVGLAAGIGVLGVVGAGGHGVTGRWIPVGYAATIVHLAAMTIWVGGLVVLALGVRRSDVVGAANRLSPWALGSVAVLAASGAVNGWRQVGTPGGITESNYGRWLIVKVVLVVIVVAIAAVTRRLLRHDPSGAAHTGLRSERIRASLIVELAGIVLVVAATSGLVDSPPPPLNPPDNAVATAARDDRVVRVELEPAVIGGTVMRVSIELPDGDAVQLAPADEITVTAALAADGIGPIVIETIPVSPNQVISHNANFPVAGVWSVEVAARYGDFDQVVFTMDIAVGT